MRARILAAVGTVGGAPEAALQKEPFSSAAWAVEGAAPCRFLRVRMTGANAQGSWSLCCAGIEFWGRLLPGDAAAQAEWEGAEARRREEDDAAEQVRLRECRTRLMEQEEWEEAEEEVGQR